MPVGLPRRRQSRDRVRSRRLPHRLRPGRARAGTRNTSDSRAKEAHPMSNFPARWAAALEHPDETQPRLILADWLEETGGATNLVRADLLRLHVQYKTARSKERARLEQRASKLFQDHPDLLAHLEPVLKRGVKPLSLNLALTAFLGAGVEPIAGGIEAGSVWVGLLHQHPPGYPTVLTIRERKGNAIEGDMEQDFSSSMAEWTGKFYFRGVVACASVLTFATYRGEGGAAVPGLYELTLKSGGWLTGTWWVPPGEHFRGKIRLRRQVESQEPEA